MTTRPQVLTLTAGDATAHLDTRTVARALEAMRYAQRKLAAEERRALLALYDTLRDLCGPDHLAAVLRDDGTTTTDTE